MFLFRSPKTPEPIQITIYNPFEHRKVDHPTSDFETLIHLFKGSLGSGILAMPLAFSNSGLWFGLIATILIGMICTHCIHILVKCAHILCKRTETPSLGFAEIAEMAFVKGPSGVQKYSQAAKLTIDLFLVVDLLGCCCIYIVFFAANMKQVIEYYSPETNLNIRIYMATLLLPLIVMNLVKNLKFLTPFSLIANILIGIGLIITFYYIFTDLPSVNERPAIANIKDMPMFFGTVIFALECIGVVMSLENVMRNPSHFIGCPGVLNFGMAFVTGLFAAVGFMGYLKYGDCIEASVTLNLPIDDIPAQSVKIIIAVAMFLTYSLQFYVPMGIIWKIIKGQISENNQNKAENFLRVFLVIGTVVTAMGIPNLGSFITLIGAVCLSGLGLIFPAIIEIVTLWEQPGLGKCNWILIKNLFLILFGILVLVTGTYVSVIEIIQNYAY